jgi:glutamine synthetase
MAPAGESAIAGVIRGLPEAQGILCGSIVSGLRMQPSNWAGVYVCWGIENREAAVRFVEGGPGSAHGGNVEVKIIDPSANPYLASAAILGLALDGMQNNAVLPPETSIDPARLSESDRERAGILRLPDAQAEVIAALDNSERLRRILGDAAVDMVVAVRRLEHERYGDLAPEQLAEKFRMAWSL